MRANVRARRAAGEDHDNPLPAPRTIGFDPNCAHSGDPIPCSVLDAFCGNGTTGVVALHIGRRFLGIDLNASYVEMARRRLADAVALSNRTVG